MRKIYWSEKYRPLYVNELCGQENLVRIVTRLLKNKEDFPHLLLHGPPGTGKCIDADAEVQLATGLTKKIKNIIPGDIVISFNEEGKQVFNKVKNLLYTGEKIGYKVTLTGGCSIIVSEDHPFLFGKVKEKRKRQNGKKIYIGKFIVPEWKNVMSLKKGDLIGIPNNYNIDGVERNDDVFVDFLGYYLGDGSTRTGSITFTNSNKLIIERVSDILGNNFYLDYKNRYDYVVKEKYVPHITKRNEKILELAEAGMSLTKIALKFNVASNTVNRIIRQKGIDRTRYSSMRKWLEFYNLYGKKSYEKFIPEFIFELKSEKISKVLEGLFITDGYIGKTQVEYYSTSNWLALGMQRLLLRFGIYSTLFKKKTNSDKGIYVVSISRKDSLIKLNNNINLGYKQKALIALISTKSNNLYGVNYRHSINDIDFISIKSIEKIDKIPMYDIEIENTHNFIANNIIVHNTTIAKAIARELYGQGKLKMFTKYVNASFERKLENIAEIENFAKGVSIDVADVKYRFIILDEADYLAPLSQPSLRSLMDNLGENCKFIITCNYPEKIIPALRSRCTEIAVKKASKRALSDMIDRVAKGENVQGFTEDIKRMLIKSANGDFRKAINTLQASVEDGMVTAERVVEVTNLLDEKSLGHLFEILDKEGIDKCIIETKKYMDKGILPDSVLDTAFDVCLDKGYFNSKNSDQLLELFADASAKMSYGVLGSVVVPWFIKKMHGLIRGN